MPWTDGDLTLQDERGWPVDDAGEKLDGEFLPETAPEGATRRTESVLAIVDDWDDWSTGMAATATRLAAGNSRRFAAGNAICDAL